MSSDKAIVGKWFHNGFVITDLTLIEQYGVQLSDEIKNAAILTDYYVEACYPGLFEPISEEEFVYGLRIAKAVVA